MRRVSEGPARANRRTCARRPAPPPAASFLQTPLARVIRCRDALAGVLAQPPEAWRFEGEYTLWALCRDEMLRACEEDGARFLDVATGKRVEQCELAEVAMAARPDATARVVDLAAYRRWKALR